MFNQPLDHDRRTYSGMSVSIEVDSLRKHIVCPAFQGFDVSKSRPQRQCDDDGCVRDRPTR